MSSYGLPGPGTSGSGNAGDADSTANFESLLAQLRRQSSPSPGPTGTGKNNAPGPNNHDQQFITNYPSSSSYSQPGSQSFYAHHSNHSNTDSPILADPNSLGPIDSPAFLPEAPTPPVGFSNAQFPPGLMNSFGAARGSGGGPGGDDRTAHLLNLLKFSGGGGSNQSGSGGNSQNQNTHQQQQQQPSSAREAAINYAPQAPAVPIAAPVIHAPAPAAADPTGLLAALMKGRLEAEPTKPEPAQHTSPWNQNTPPSSGTQQYLLNLLNRPKPSQHDASDMAESSLLTPPPAEDELKEVSSSHGGRSAEPTLVGTVPSHSEFDYAGSSPVNRTPKSSTTPGADSLAAGPAQQPSAPGFIQILKKPDSAQSGRDQKTGLSDRGSLNSPESVRRKLEHASSPLSQTSAARSTRPVISPLSESAPHNAEPKESVTEAVNCLAEQADREAREALARAQQEQAHAEIAQDLEHMLSARTDEEFAQSAQSAGQALKRELDQEQNKAALESALTPQLAKEVREIVDETAGHASQGPIADSWESAEADEIVVIEETTTPIKVYNFPMKPWITISVQDTNEPRPVFREEAILDIARLKKDFDQIDRNLVSASESYMAYGMSKQGGLRVIRQEDGKDAKLFTDTKDRIFNVAISTCPPSSSQHPKEAIIGTGVSGTVYWVQLKSGQRDHLEDAHPEQYGFALPPISAQEGGDMPGGVLKTRARASSMHPDFFAVGRGKSINIIWPQYIFEQNLFKNVHDRVVDTEKLLKQCSLKINTGKAGKDFTFSQDDTIVVSLDKSGRVKFWDVRDLTAVKDGSDPNHSMPAQTSLEIKEPLMTLTTTPEGEKAWPTSVLLLDKYRPYQKRAALRYMIVGMKQNHTLQLWDLALGKPVQEFNFPHNKESDAVCSVMYHAPSSMIVVGHPTRNSIYFLHLSAPKYNLKNLSQVDYIQRLVAQDPSIPQPESTAVISGIREYSFANKGVLRSLNMLENPAASADGDEPTLFELYAMHSKGVTCLFVKQAELGWTKDNKIIHAVDAIDAGLVKLSKLVAPPPTQVTEVQQTNGQNDSAPVPQIRIASRGPREILQKAPSGQGEEKKGADPLGISSNKLVERKENDETPVPQPERNEKKGRSKKKAAAAAAAAAAATSDPSAANGAPDNNRAGLQGRAGNKASRNNAESSDAPFATLTAEQLGSVVAKMETSVVGNVSQHFDAVFKELIRQMDDLAKKRDQDFSRNQSHLLQMVADVLNENTESVLKSLIIEQIQKTVVPAVCDSINSSVTEQLSTVSDAHFTSVQRDIHNQLPTMLNHAIQKPEFVKAIVDKVSHNVNAHVENHLSNVFNSLMTTLPSTIATMAAKNVHQRIREDVKIQLEDAMDRLEDRRRDEDSKLDRLIAQTKDLSNAISSLAATQAKFSQDLLALKEQVHDQTPARSIVPQETPRSAAQGRGSTDSYNQPPNYGPQQHHGQQHHGQQQLTVYSREERERMEVNQLAETVAGLMRNGNYDEAILRWLHNPENAEEIYQKVLWQYPPEFIADLQPLLLLSVGTTLTDQFHTGVPNLLQKIDILRVLLHSFQQKVMNLDDQVREVTPKIMTLLRGRIEQLLLEVSRVAPHDSSLKSLSTLAQAAGNINNLVQGRHGSMGPMGSMQSMPSMGSMHLPSHHNAPY
ncbi:hypothetical protein QBC38DRAFT_487960 [Podospora fimiseda]|uniref:EDC4-like protein pdc1 beta-propeller domain-containing protein n=1 Tax=Podospora fimiseda TaxID=252190 RepID=A0AAN7BHF1_9PEZI|nr:hypothetical protein QBC38DRAFT_487960 [Podospora fimiseda]